MTEENFSKIDLINMPEESESLYRAIQEANNIFMRPNGNIKIGADVSAGGKPIIGNQSTNNSSLDENNVPTSFETYLQQPHHIEYPWIFVTGSSGYIGSHLSAHLKSNTSYNLMQIDWRAQMLPHTTKFCDIFADEDFASDTVLNSINQYKPHTVVHLAAHGSIGPGQKDPIPYWDNNVSKTIKLLDACVRANVKNFIFASSSSVYADNANFALVDESSQVSPITAYARTKLSIEMALQDCFHSYGMNSISFRFFNAAGAHGFYDIGPLYGGNHLLEQIMQAIVHKTPLTVFGNDYNTYDGTAIRDYTHVMDIVDATCLGIQWLPKNPGSHIINLGSGTGSSVQDVIDRTEQILSLSVPYRYGDRRDGDSVRRIADITVAEKMMGWKPKRLLDDIIKDSFKWYNSRTYLDLYQRKVWNIY